MKAKANVKSSVLLSIFVFVAAMLIIISVPFVSYAQTGTLGTASPKVYCTYEQNGVVVDGNKLTAGTYDVSFVLSGMTNVSIIEITAAYNQEQVTVADAPTALISDDETAAFKSMGYKLADGNIVFGFVSTNTDCSPVTESGQVIARVAMTFASDCDAADYITVSTNPNLTFLQADYGDGYADAYALVDSFEGYNGNLYLMTCDVTPGAGHSVSGNLVVMTSVSGTTENVAVNGVYTIDVYDSTGTKLDDKCTTSTLITDENGNKSNTFTINDLADGTYRLTISSEFAITRSDITVKVSGNDITANSIPLLVADFDIDTAITAADALEVYASVVKSVDLRYDLDGDTAVTAADALIVYACAGTPSYGEIVIE